MTNNFSSYASCLEIRKKERKQRGGGYIQFMLMFVKKIRRKMNMINRSCERRLKQFTVIVVKNIRE